MAVPTWRVLAMLPLLGCAPEPATFSGDLPPAGAPCVDGGSFRADTESRAISGSYPNGDVGQPVLGFDGTEHVALWHEGGTWRLASLRQGVPSNPVDLPDLRPGPAVWTGTEFAVTWTKGDASTGVWLAAVGPDGTITRSPTRVALLQDPSEALRIAPSPEGFGITLRTVIDGLGYARLLLLSGEEAVDVRLTPIPTNIGPAGVPSDFASAVWHDGGWSAAWINTQWTTDAWFARFTPDGSRSDPVLISSDATFSATSIAATEHGYGVVFGTQGDGGSEVTFAHLDGDGVLGAVQVLSRGKGTAFFPSMLYNGAEYGITWMDKDGDPPVFARLDDDGAYLAYPANTGPAPATAMLPVLSWAEDRYAIGSLGYGEDGGYRSLLVVGEPACE